METTTHPNNPFINAAIFIYTIIAAYIGSRYEDFLTSGTKDFLHDIHLILGVILQFTSLMSFAMFMYINRKHLLNLISRWKIK